MSHRIPQPPTIPFLGNITQIEAEVPTRSFALLAKQYGEIYKLNMAGNEFIVVTSHTLCNELSDDRRFHKGINPSLRQVRNLVKDGLFTAFHGEPNWGIAHRLLMPAFGPANVRSMFDDMMDIASQLLLKWERFGPSYVIEPSTDYTRLTLDTLALCGMNYRINSFYRDTTHPFVQAMADSLTESGMRARRPAAIQALNFSANKKYLQDRDTMKELADTIIQERKANPIEKNDLLNIMLNGVDKETGARLSDETIGYNLNTFLIAGHETTSGALSFATYYLIKYPSAMAKVQEEVDRVVGDRQIQVGDLGKLHYTSAVLRESLRLSPTAPGRTVSPNEDTIIGGGKYAVKKGDLLTISMTSVQRDPAVWGEDAEEFKPERVIDGEFEKLPPNAWQPFGYGMRACIGRPFALQEATLVLALVAQKFDLVANDPSYNLEIKSTLTVKPKGFNIHAIPRGGKPRLYSMPARSVLQPDTGSDNVLKASGAQAGKQPLYVLYGSNTGSSEAFAQRVASAATSQGFRSFLETLDSAGRRLPTDGPIIVVTASFEGQPADNAAKFVSWLSSIKGKELDGVSFAVFGCGNHEWANTYQRIPKLIDQLMAEHGGRRILERGEGDAGGGDFFEAFDKWEANLFELLSKEYNQEKASGVSGLEIKEVESDRERAKVLRQDDSALGHVIENIVLTAPGAPEKRHLEFELPENMTYHTGDYLAILPTNPVKDVHRVMTHFGVSPEQEVAISSSSATSLPLGKPITLSSLFGGYVELSQPASSRDLRTLLELVDPSSKSAQYLKDLAGSYSEKVVAKRLSVLDILEINPEIKLSLASFLEMLPSMRIRQYSISSSDVWNPQHVTLTVSVLNAPAASGRPDTFLGVASNYLATLKKGDKVNISVRKSAAAFQPPSDPTVPVIAFCAGSGLAPMRAFIQDRAVQKASGRDVGRMLLFFGCRTPTDDYLYSKTDLEEWTKGGIVEVRPAFSRSPNDSGGCKYVQDRVWSDRQDIKDMFAADAKLFTCGSGKVALGVKEKLIAIVQEAKGIDEAEAAGVFDKITKERYATDIFD